ncbi:MAG: hypothetical protein ACP5D2_00300 [Candidatus Nanoarchaeia archaeon]
MKYLIFDAGPLITLTMNGLLEVLEMLKKEFDGEFIITPKVKHEVIDKPMNIKEYELEGVKIQSLLDRNVLKMSADILPDKELERETRKIMHALNSALSTKKDIKLIQEGEASCIAFSRLCQRENMVVIDERTTRLLTECPLEYKAMMEARLKTRIKINKQNLKLVKDIKYIRSAELLYIAYKKGLLKWKNKHLLDALLYGVKHKGAAISSSEIEEIKKLAKV